MIFITESGTRYALASGFMTRHHDGDNPLRRDDEPVKVLEMPYGPPQVGKRFVVLLAIREDDVPTVRDTSPVKWIREES